MSSCEETCVDTLAMFEWYRGIVSRWIFGMAALQLLMLLVGSDLGLSNVRPGFIVGGVIAFC